MVGEPFRNACVDQVPAESPVGVHLTNKKHSLKRSNALSQSTLSFASLNPSKFPTQKRTICVNAVTFSSLLALIFVPVHSTISARPLNENSFAHGVPSSSFNLWRNVSSFI